MRPSPTPESDATPRAGGGMIGTEAIHRDLSAVVGAFSRRLYDRGMPVSPGRSVQYLRALQLTQPGSRRQLYLTTRAIFVTDARQIATFDRVFGEVFGSPAGADADGPDAGLGAPRPARRYAAR